MKTASQRSENCISECQEISFIIKGCLIFISVTVCMSLCLHECAVLVEASRGRQELHGAVVTGGF